MADKSDGMEWEYYDDNEVLPDFWQGFVDADADFKKPLQFWLKYFSNPYENSYGWNIYREHWRVWVPLLLAPRHGTTSVDKLSSAEERRVQEVLLDPLEQFIAGAQQSLPVFAKLSESDAPPAVCGYVFKNGDTCYNCRDCGQDATCVLCAKCFTDSAHKNHRYRMHTSEGGGICDCGDSEAFTKDYLCSTHQEQAKEGKSAAEVLKTFPQDLRKRAEDLLYNVCVYAVNIVADFKNQLDLKSGAKEKELFPDLQYPLRHSNYCVVLLNDENHSYEDVIRVLKKVLPNAQEKTVVDLTTFVDKFGKAVIKVGKYQECQAVSERISSLTRLPHSTVLKSAVVTSLQVAHERFAARLLSWVPSLFKKSSGFRALISQVLLMRSEATNVKIVRHTEETLHPIGEAILLNELNTWKQMRNLWMELLLDGLMKDYESKRELAVLFTTNYPSLVSDFIQDDQEKDASVMSLSVQIFTVPSISIYLIENHDAVTQMMQGFIGLLTESTDEDDKLELNWLDEEKSEFQRMLTSIKDITYLLSVVPSGQEAWTHLLRTNFLRGLESILKALSYMQGMDGMTRQVGLHVEHEDQQWRLAYELQSSFNEIVRLVTAWVLSDPAVLTKSIEMTLTKISQHTPSFPELTKHLAFLGPPELFNVLDYDMLSRPVSINAPLHRFVINLIAASSKHKPAAAVAAAPGRLLQRIEAHLPLLKLVDPVLQAIVLVGQINVGMWRRNGGRADSLAFLYNNRTYLTGLRESDLLLLQLGAAVSTNTNQFLVNILARYKLAKWVTGELDSESATRSDDFVEKCNGLADQFLLLLIALVGERHAAGVGEDMTSRLELRRDLIHILCIEPLSHSGILKKLTNLEENEPDIDEILAEVSELKLCTKNPGKKVYYLRSGLESEFNMFFYGFTKEQQTAAQEHQLNSRLKKGDPCPPPHLPRLTTLFAGVNKVMESSVVLQTCAVTLRRAVDTTASRSKYLTENQLHKVLYLLCLGLRQDEANSCSTFRDKMAAAGIVDLLNRVAGERSDLPEHITKLATWIQSRVSTKVTPGPAAQEEMDTGEGSSEQLRKRRAEAAKARKAKILAQMSQMQKNFANENKCELDSIRGDEAAEPVNRDQGETDETETVCLGPGQTEHKESAASHQCILCQETEVEGSSATLVMTTYVQRTTVLSKVPTYDGSRGREPPTVDELLMPVDRGCVPNISSCGHLMHARCYQKYFESQVMKERDRNISIMTRNFSNYDVSAAEYTCPICERLCNTIIPVVQPISTLRKKQTAAPLVEVGLNTFLLALKDVADSLTVREEAGPALTRFSSGRSRLELAAAFGPEVSDCFPENTDSAAPLIDEVYNMLNVFSMSVFTNSLVVNPDEQDYRVALMTMQASAATLVHLELCLTQDHKPLFGPMTSRDEQLVRSLVRVVTAYGSSGLRLQYIQKNAMYLLATLFGRAEADCSVFDVDAFGLLVSLVVSLPCLFASRPPRFMSGQGVELHCLKICLVVHVVQLLLGYPERCFIEFLGTRSKTGADLIHKVMACIAAKRKFSLDVTKMNCTKMFGRLEKDVLPFLRTAALLFHELTGINPGRELVQDGGREYRTLACYLGLPASLSLLLESPAAATLLDLTLLGPSNLTAGDQPIRKYPLLPSSFRRSLPPVAQGATKQYFPLGALAGGAEWAGGLIPLPRDYTELLHRASEFSCPNSVTGESKDPALCLVCGVMVCSNSHCCEDTLEGQHVGGCTAHARLCSAGTGIFLKTRDCYIFLLHKLYRGAILPAPYLDEYGETDQRLKRGNPLFLDQDRYSEINRMWCRNEVPEKIARKFDADVVMLINWQMF